MQFLFSLVLVFLFSSLTMEAQAPIFLQLEEINSTKLIKFYPGQKIKFTTNEYPDAWRTEKIESIIPEENLIVLSEGYIKPEDIHSVQMKNGPALIFGHMLSKFAAGWLVFGAYATIVDSGYKMSFTEVLIGSVTAAVGWVVRKLFGKKNHPMGKLYRLRIVDIRFPPPLIQTP